jgi:hypothetical protein
MWNWPVPKPGASTVPCRCAVRPVPLARLTVLPASARSVAKSPSGIAGALSRRLPVITSLLMTTLSLRPCSAGTVASRSASTWNRLLLTLMVAVETLPVQTSGTANVAWPSVTSPVSTSAWPSCDSKYSLALILTLSIEPVKPALLAASLNSPSSCESPVLG